MNSLFDLEQKKGTARKLSGLLTVYARVAPPSDESSPADDRMQAVIQSGYLVAQGNYRDQNNLRDFIKQEFGSSVDDEEGMKHFLEGLGGIEGALDPDKFRDKLRELESMEDYIPTPAKMVGFSSEEDILREEGDVYYLGYFDNTANANLAVNAVTILYQAKYRESQISHIRGEIDSMIHQIEGGGSFRTVDVPDHIAGDVEQVLQRYLIPELILARENRTLADAVKADIRMYLSWYDNSSDIDALVSCAAMPRLTDRDNQYIELLIRKIASVGREEFDRTAEIVARLRELGDRGADYE
ncbi:MAG: hypothetical protein ACQEQV_07785 [Fibrobacterota bacterium]